jgi:acetyl esterase/lipase
MMAAATTSTSLVPVQPVFTQSERLALAGFLAGYRGLTREAYTLDLRQFSGWCRSRSLPLFSVRRADIETFARELEARGRARATAPKPRKAIRRLCPVVGSWPGNDFTTKAAGVLETELTAAGIPHDLKVYPGAKHAFFNDQWRACHPAAAADSWQRVLAFFAEHVREGPPRPG